MLRPSESDKKNIWHPFTPLDHPEAPLLISSGSGVFLITEDGRKIIDAISSWWVNLHGHAHPDIARAVSEQARTLEHVIFAGFTHEPAIRLSEKLLSILPSNQNKIFFSDNGSTAVEVALKMTIQYWHNQGVHKNKFIAIEGAYHGDTFGAMAVGARGIFTEPFSPNLFHVEFIPFPETEKENVCIGKLKELIDLGNIGGFIYEPLLQGASGMRMYKPAILDEMISYAQSKNVLCIADEVLTGFGRTGKLFASDYLTTKPDLIALSKGLTGGTLPLGVTACSGKVTDAFRGKDFTKTFFHGHSYTANPIACAAANASFDLLMKPECHQQIKKISELHNEFVALIKTHVRIKDARSLGTVLALELVSVEKTSYVNPIRENIYSYFLQRNILLRPLGNVLYILPPYVISERELVEIYSTITKFLDELV